MNSVTGELTSKVSKDDLVSTINQTAGAVKISAQCIDLEGYVTATELSAMKADVTWLKGLTVDVGILNTGTLSAGIASVDALTANVLILGKSTVGWQKQTVVTGISDALRVSKTSQTITYATPEGGENTINVLTNVQVFAGGHYSTKEISYLGASASE